VSWRDARDAGGLAWQTATLLIVLPARFLPLSAALPWSLGAPFASRRAVITAAGSARATMAAFAWVGADNKHAGEFLQLDHYYCCDAVDFESLSATAARLVKATGELPAELQARALWRFLRREGTETLRSLDEDALDGLEALDDLAEQHGVVPRAGAPLLLEVREPRGADAPAPRRAHRATAADAAATRQVRTQCALAHLRGREPDMPRFAKAVDALFGEDQPTTMAKSAATALLKRCASHAAWRSATRRRGPARASLRALCAKTLAGRV
jgi:hypothetical protein